MEITISSGPTTLWIAILLFDYYINTKMIIETFTEENHSKNVAMCLSYIWRILTPTQIVILTEIFFSVEFISPQGMIWLCINIRTEIRERKKKIIYYSILQDREGHIFSRYNSFLFYVFYGMMHELVTQYQIIVFKKARPLSAVDFRNWAGCAYRMCSLCNAILFSH